MSDETTLEEAIRDALTDVTASLDTEDYRDWLTDATNAVSRAVLALLPAPHPQGGTYPPLPSEATVETLWKSLNDLHEYAMEAIAAEKACAAAATEAHINGVCAPAPQETLRDALADLLPFASTSLAHDMDEGVEVGALYEDEPPDARHSVGYHRPDCRLCAAVSNVRALLAAAPAPTEAGDE